MNQSRIFLKTLMLLLIISLIFLFFQLKQLAVFTLHQIQPLNPDDVVTDEETGIRYVYDQLIVSFSMDTDLTTIENVIDDVNGEIIGGISDIKIVQVKINNLNNKADLDSVISQLKTYSAVKAACLNTVTTITSTENPVDPWKEGYKAGDKIYNEKNPGGSNWGLEAIKAYSAWQLGGELSTVKVGVVDGGFYINNPELKIPKNHATGVDGSYLLSGSKYNEIVSEFWNQHGTFVSGIICAIRDNQIGVAGVANNCDLFVFRTEQQEIAVMFGIERCLQEKCKIINLSMGNTITEERQQLIFDGKISVDSDIDTLNECVMWTNALNKWIKRYGGDFLIIEAAGNDFVDARWNGNLCCITDEKYQDYFLVVGGSADVGKKYEHYYDTYIDEDGYKHINGTNFGNAVDIVAPGEDIYGLWHNEDLSNVGLSIFDIFHPFEQLPDYASFNTESGTSAAAPFVTGTACLVSGANPDLSCSEIRQIILDTAEYAFELYGTTYNMVNAAAAVEKAIKQKASKPSEDSGRIETQTEMPQTGSPVIIEDQWAHIDNEDVYVQVSYPKISGLLDSEFEEALNAEIKQEIDDAISAAEQFAEEVSGPHYVESSYEVVRNDGTFLSIYMDVYCDGGGAHGEDYTLYYNILNTNPGVRLSLSNLFNTGNDYISILNEKILKQIEQDPELSQENYFTTITENQTFYLTDSELVITFQKGDINAYLLDPPVFRIPFEGISDIIVPWLIKSDQDDNTPEFPNINLQEVFKLSNMSRQEIEAIFGNYKTIIKDIDDNQFTIEYPYWELEITYYIDETFAISIGWTQNTPTLGSILGKSPEQIAGEYNLSVNISKPNDVDVSYYLFQNYVINLYNDPVTEISIMLNDSDLANETIENGYYYLDFQGSEDCQVSPLQGGRVVEVYGGYMVTCDILDEAEITYDEYNQLLKGQTVTKKFGLDTWILTLSDTYDQGISIDATINDQDDYFYIFSPPTPSTSALLCPEHEGEGVLYLSSKTELFISGDTVVSNPYDDMDDKSFDNYLETGYFNDLGGLYADYYYAKVVNGEIVEIKTWYSP